MSKRLIVNADDYGLTLGVSAGIRMAHLKGIVTTTTAMLNMPSTIQDLQLARAECPNLGLGVHLVLTAGKPLRPHQSVSTLVTSNNCFLSIKDIQRLPSFFMQLDPIQLRDEWGLQIETFLQTGLSLDHLDSHHHISYYHEKPYEVMLDLADEYDVPMRSIYPPPGSNSLFGKVAQHILESFSKFASNLLSIYPLKQPDGLIVSFMHQGASLDNLLQVLAEIPNGTFELMCHPGIIDEELLTTSSYNTLRQTELNALTDLQTHDLLRHYQIELINFQQL